MADTVNYEWTKPTPGGSSGAWGSILNAALDAIDAVLYALVGKLDEQMLVLALTGSGVSWATSNTGASATLPGPGHFVIPLPALRKGQRITAFTTRGAKSSTATATAKLAYYDDSGAETIVSAGHALAVADFVLENVTTSGLTHDVADGRGYYIKIEIGVSTGSVFVGHVQLAVEAAP